MTLSIEQPEFAGHLSNRVPGLRTTLAVPSYRFAGHRSVDSSPHNQVVIGANFYQPSRQVSHHRLKHINSDPGGRNWTEVINYESYRPSSKMGLLDKVTYNYQWTLDRQLKEIDSETAEAYRTHLRTNGVASSPIHFLWPDAIWEDKTIAVEVAINDFVSITGKKPKYFWLPEAAIDTPTLQVLANHDIEGFFCAPNQVYLKNGEPADNTPTRISLPWKSILVIPFDGVLSHKLAFEDDPNNPLRDNADKFTREVVMPRLRALRNGSPLVAYTDGEWGHHMKFGVAFMRSLVNDALPEAGIKVVSMNEIDMSNVSIAEGWIKERSAWSCEHPNLARWRGECGCGAEGLDTGWKRPFYQAVHDLNWELTKIARSKLGEDYVEQIVRNFEEAFQNPGSSDNPSLSIISAKVSALAALTSCGTFYKDPGVSGGINILFARQAIEYLVDAGLYEDAGRIWGQFLKTMQQVRNPAYYNRTGLDMTRDLLGVIADYNVTEPTILGEVILNQNGSISTVRQYRKGWHLGMGVLTNGWQGPETIVDVIRSTRDSEIAQHAA